MKQKYENGNEYYYVTDGHGDVLSKYRGCGSGWIVVDKETDRIIDMAYSDDMTSMTEGGEQNIVGTDRGGEVLGEDEEVVIYAVNFSCCTACLF